MNRKSQSFRLRGTTVPVITLALSSADQTALEGDIDRKVSEAGDSLAGGLAVIDLSALGDEHPPLQWLVAQVRRFGLHPVAVIGTQEAQAEEVSALDLAVLPASSGSARSADTPVREEPVAAAPSAPEPPASAPQTAASARPAPPAASAAADTTTLVVDRPVRSGQRIYARGCDLVLLAGASAGSELIADGNIHCYGPLRGRALAGASGDHEAQIFALDFEAELVSVAGVYKAFERLPDGVRGKAIRASLEMRDGQSQILLSPLLIAT
ncbi:MAG: septum site-determining protein MinC [Burkholderiales bacterium]|nr:septum site-determining protein MinC [Burkholderiales bacterium]